MKTILNGLARQIAKNKGFIRFIVVGCSNSLVDYLVFAFSLSVWKLDLSTCQLVGYVCGMVNSFLLNKAWTFENHGAPKHALVQMVRFLIVNLSSLMVTMLLLDHMVTSLGINAYIGKLMTIPISQCINYYGYKCLVFRQEHP
jgi:putative flippase GtrA